MEVIKSKSCCQRLFNLLGISTLEIEENPTERSPLHKVYSPSSFSVTYGSTASKTDQTSVDVLGQTRRSSLSGLSYYCEYGACVGRKEGETHNICKRLAKSHLVFQTTGEYPKGSIKITPIKPSKA